MCAERVPCNYHDIPRSKSELVMFRQMGDNLTVTTPQDTFNLKFFRYNNYLTQEFKIYKQGEQEYWLDRVYLEDEGLRIAIIPLKPYLSEVYSLNLTYPCRK